MERGLPGSRHPDGWSDDAAGLRARVQAHDWSASPLGPMQGWPRSLHAAVELILPNHFASVVLWGRDLIQIYNQGFRRIMADKHPAGLGQPTRECWPEVWHINEPIYEQVWRGETVTRDDALYPLVRQGSLADAWFDLCYSPIRDDDGGIGGILVTMVEVTARHLDARGRSSAEAALRTTEERYRSLFETMDEGCCVMEVEYGEDGSIAELYFRDVNQAFERQGGFRNALGRRVSDFMPNLERHWRDAFTRVMQTGESARVENYLAASARWYSVHFARIGGQGSRLLAAVFQDVTGRKRVERLTSRLAAIVECSDDAIISKNLDGIIQTWNTGAERMFGFTAEEAIGRPVTILMPPDRIDEEPGILARIRRGEPVDHYETVRQRRDGTRLDVSLSVSPVFDAHGRVVAASKIARDITERKRMEAILAEGGERQGFLLELSDAMREQPDEAAIGAVCTGMVAEHLGVDRCYIAHLSQEGGWARLGPEYRAPGLPSVFGEAGEVLLSSFPASVQRLETGALVVPDIFGDPGLADSEQAMLGALQGMAAFVVVPIRAGARNLVWALVVGSASPRNWTREEVHLLEQVAERTWAAAERARTEAALRESEAKLRHADRAKDEFMAMLGHELRNPLSPITTTLSLMKLRAPDTLADERRVIEKQVQYLTGLVDDLLDVSRIARGKLELNAVPVAIEEVVATAVETSQPLFEEREQTLRTNIQNGLMVEGDSRRLVQVLVNLLTNSAKYSPRGRSVELTAEADGGEVVLRVRDQGQGIDPRLLDKVFDAFTQEEQALDRTRGGLGLGLAIVRNVVQLHGGSVAAASEGRDRGSEFTVRLPLLEVRDAAGRDEPAATAAALPATGDRRSTRVLIVDDYPLAAESLSMLLDALGYDTRIVYDGPAALAALIEFKPAIALVDIGLPVMNGYEVARNVRGMPEFADLPLVAITGYGQATDRARMVAAGFDECLIKPLQGGKVAEAIEKLLVAIAG